MGSCNFLMNYEDVDHTCILSVSFFFRLSSQFEMGFHKYAANLVDSEQASGHQTFASLP